jgi:heterodisulfide reductase subunit C
MNIAISKERLRLSQDLQALTGENALLCYQCKKCTLGCPSAYAMRMKPHELMRAIQLGGREELYWSGTLWICLSCETCNTRCPQGINILRLIDGLRELAKRSGYYNPYPAIPAMQGIFLALVKRFGRIYPLGLALLTHLQMLTPFKDLDLASSLLRKGRLWIFPRKTRGVKELRRVMSRLRELEQKEQKGWKALNVKE